MSKQMVFLKYNFIFDGSETWSHLSQFEDSLAEFFMDHDMEAKIIRPVGGQMGERLMLISKVEKVSKPKEVEKSDGVKIPEKKIVKIKRGGKLPPKEAKRKKYFFTKKGRVLKGPENKARLGGYK